MAYAVGGIAVWLLIGFAAYRPAAKSWRRRWGAGPEHTPPFGDYFGILMGPAALGCLAAELNIRRRGQ